MPTQRILARGLLLGTLVAVMGGCQSPANVDARIPVDAAPCGLDIQSDPAPDKLRQLANPLAPTEDNIAAGRRLYQSEAHPVACAECHGDAGLGDGPIGIYLVPPPVNFTCPEVVDTPDGQLYWVILQGSNYLGGAGENSGMKRPGRRRVGTAMRPHRYYLTEEETWQLVLYLRELGRASETRDSS